MELRHGEEDDAVEHEGRAQDLQGRVRGTALRYQQIEVSWLRCKDGLAQQHCEHHDQQGVAHVLRGAAGAEEKDAEGAVAMPLQERAHAECDGNEDHQTSQRQETPHRQLR